MTHANIDIRKGVGNMVQWVKCLPHMLEDLSSDPSTCMEKYGHVVVLSVSPSPGVVSRQVDPISSLASQYN